MVQLGHFRPQSDGLLEVGEGLGMPAAVAQGVAQPVKNVNRAGLEPQTIAEDNHGLVELTLLGEGQSHVRERRDAVGLEPEHLAEGEDRLVELAAVGEGDSQVVMVVGRFRTQFHGAAEQG